MPAAAKICLQCKCSQSFFRNQLTLLAGLGGLIALLTYATSSLHEIRKNLFWRDAIDIVSIDSDNGIVIQNVGDGDVFVEGIHFDSNIEGGARYSSSVLIGETIAPGELIKHNSTQKTLDGGVLQVGATSKLTNVNDALRMTRTSPDCLVASMYSTNSVRYKGYVNFLGDKLIQLRVKPKVIFHSGSKVIENEFDAVVLFLAAHKKLDCWQ